MKIKSIERIFAWYDLWFGFFWDKKKKWLYFLPLPTIGIIIKFENQPKPNAAPKNLLPTAAIDEIEKTNGWVNSPARPAHMHGALEALTNPSIYNKSGLISFEDAYDFFKWTQSRKCTYYQTVGGYWLSCMENESKKTTQELYQIYKEENGS